MDIVNILAIFVMFVGTCWYTMLWVKEKYAIGSANLRTALMLMVIVSLLSVLMFGTRLMLRPDVTLTYTEKQIEIYSNLTINEKQQHIVDSKRLVACEVSFVKSYPLMVVLGHDTRTIKYKLPCDLLSPEMKSEIATVTAYMKEETK